MSDKRRPTGEFWITAAAVAIVFYATSFGPACWISSRLDFGSRAIGTVYWPLLAASWPYDKMWNSIAWCATFGAESGWEIEHLDGNDEFRWARAETVFTSRPTRIAPATVSSAGKSRPSAFSK